MPEYQKKMRSFASHISLSSKVIDIYRAQNLRDVENLEQDLATGVSEEAKKVKKKECQEKLSALISTQTIPFVLKFFFFEFLARLVIFF